MPPATAKTDPPVDAQRDHSVRALGSGAPLTRDDLSDVSLRTRPRPSLLNASLTTLKGAGPRLAATASEQLGIETLGDLLWSLPHGYRDRSEVRNVADLRIGEEATVLVEVRSVRVRPTRRRNLRIVEANVADASGPMKAVWFNQHWVAEKLKQGAPVLLSGKLDRSGFRVAAHELAGEAAKGERPLHTLGIVPVHPASDRLKPQRIREWAWQASSLCREAIEPLPAEIRVRRGLAAVGDAL